VPDSQNAQCRGAHLPRVSVGPLSAKFEYVEERLRRLFAALGAGVLGSSRIGARRARRNGDERKGFFCVVRSRTILGAGQPLSVLLCSAAPLRAQVDAGSILGTVSDASGDRFTRHRDLTNEAPTQSGDHHGLGRHLQISPVRIGSYKITATIQVVSDDTRETSWSTWPGRGRSILPLNPAP